MLDPQAETAFAARQPHPGDDNADLPGTCATGTAPALGRRAPGTSGRSDALQVAGTVVAQPLLTAPVPARLPASWPGAVLLVIGVVRLRCEPLPATPACPLSYSHASPPIWDERRGKQASSQGTTRYGPWRRRPAIPLRRQRKRRTTRAQESRDRQASARSETHSLTVAYSCPPVANSQITMNLAGGNGSRKKSAKKTRRPAFNNATRDHPREDSHCPCELRRSAPMRPVIESHNPNSKGAMTHNGAITSQ